ncbi:hypothetical protein BS50DRAFT_546721 [Corynespora cassiicola Philippines]|uniref:Rhodopsin domain-containing protein n=1 Tax=Corynespora cassiicola Philippines TaxID=1448308 RepID=A0A2T2P172_CORCC|nr:hypothetical protein BS50DRAFT_546721 [Corynespora cassiicola Philippines]
MAREAREVMFETVIAFLVINTIAFGLRVLSRGYVHKRFGADDWMMVVAYLAFVVTIVMVILALHHGYGLHMSELSEAPERLRNALKYFIIGQPIYGVACGAVQLSIGLLLLRIASTPIYRHVIIVSLAIIASSSLATSILLALQCRPLSFAWKGSETGTCFHPSVIVKIGYAFSVMDIASSWGYSILPIPILWHMDMHWRAKISILLILAMGVVSSTATILRFKGLMFLVNNHDLLYDMVPANTWSLVEVSIAILAACLATYPPLLRRLHIQGFDSDTDDKPKLNRSLPVGVYGSSQWVHELGRIKRSGKVELNDVTIEGGFDGDSQELILDRNRIQRNTSISVEYSQRKDDA